MDANTAHTTTNASPSLRMGQLLSRAARPSGACSSRSSTGVACVGFADYFCGGKMRGNAVPDEGQPSAHWQTYLPTLSPPVPNIQPWGHALLGGERGDHRCEVANPAERPRRAQDPRGLRLGLPAQPRQAAHPRGRPPRFRPPQGRPQASGESGRPSSGQVLSARSMASWSASSA